MFTFTYGKTACLGLATNTFARYVLQAGLGGGCDHTAHAYALNILFCATCGCDKFVFLQYFFSRHPASRKSGLWGHASRPSTRPAACLWTRSLAVGSNYRTMKLSLNPHVHAEGRRIRHLFIWCLQYIYIIYSKYKYECIVHFDWFCLWAFTALTAYLKASKMVNDPSSGMAKQKIQGNVLSSSEKSEPAQASQLHFRLPSFAFSPLLRTFVNLLRTRIMIKSLNSCLVDFRYLKWWMSYIADHSWPCSIATL